MDKQRLSKEDRLRKIVIEGYQILQEEKSYKQNQIINKLRTLNSAVSTASFSNLLTNKTVGLDVLQKVAIGIQEIMTSELGYVYDVDKFSKQVGPNWIAILVKETNLTTPTIENDAIAQGFVFHSEGRVTIQHKTAFIQSAQSEVIEVGTRLKTFTDYFFSRSEQEYKAHIIALLKRGVKLRFYMLDPDSNEAALYFRDRAKVQEDETDSINEMKKVLTKIQKIHTEFEKENYKGSFEVYLYKHLPTNHFFVVDGYLSDGKMMVSHYLYGLRRAECPVIEIDKRFQASLFKKYYKSLELFTEGARRVIPKM
jgi:hypothetical protein